MTISQIIITILVAIIGSASGTFGFIQFMVKRKDDKEARDVQKQIDDAITKAKEKFIAECGAIGDAQIVKAKEELYEEMQKGLEERGLEGKKRFDINSASIQENTKMIQEVLDIQKSAGARFEQLAESMTALNEAVVSNSKVTRACAEGIRSTTYDKILLVANKALSRGAITISEKTNLKQLYQSWTELQGDDPTITTYFEDCMKLPSIPNEN